MTTFGVGLRPHSVSIARTVVAAAIAAAMLIDVSAALAFPTRVHIMLSNKIREALLASDDGQTVQLEGSPHAVVLSREDADAILDHPLAFRAGAVGPDNLLFPGMTDATHGMHFHPYEQCEVLYQEAFSSEERAYAMGCFLHGSTDAVAHHFVNYFTGETFTLNPAADARENSFSNVARHILIEGLILDSASESEPENFSTGNMLHTMPRGFVLRTYYNPGGQLWQFMGATRKEAFELETSIQDEDALLVEIVRELGYAAIDHLIMLPVYLDDAERRLEHLKSRIVQAIADYQDPGTPRGALLQVGPGPDGELGTEDDTTGCSVTCPEDYGKYFIYLGLLEPRYDAMGRELPPAWDKFQDELLEDLFEFMPVLMQTVETLSARLNGPLVGNSQGLDITPNEVRALLRPLDDWATRTADVDHGTVAQSVVPNWILSITAFFDSIGLTIDVPDVLNLLFGPIVHEIVSTLENFVVEGVRFFLEELLDFVLERKDAILEEYEMRLWASSPADYEGHALTDFYKSGLYIHSFNMAAATLAEHQMILPEGSEDIGRGPTSFDASYTLEWSQVGLCDNLREAVLPLGLGIGGLLSVMDGQILAAEVDGDTPVECHDGSVGAFSDNPSAESCAVVDLDALLDNDSHQGSLSRAFPPQYDPMPPTCRNIPIPGLPAPPVDDCPDGPDCEEPPDRPICVSDDQCGRAQNCIDGRCVTRDPIDPGPDAVDPGPGTTPEPPPNAGGGGGGGCQAVPVAPSGGIVLILFGFLIAGLRRKRAAVAALAVVALVGCGDPDDPAGDPVMDMPDPMPDAGMMDDVPPMMMDVPQMMDDVPEDVPEMMMDVPVEEEMPPVDLGRELREALYGTVWHGEHTRDEDGRTRTRAFEVVFDNASLWAEIRNPFGPARQRVLRSFVIEDDGATVESVVQFPEGWERPPNPGASETWTFEIEDSTPRKLRITSEAGAEVFTEGPFPEPEQGLTAQVRTFGSGVIEDAFCTSGLGGIEHAFFWEFARGESDVEARGYDVVAGARLSIWEDPGDMNRFAVTDVDGFDRFGGTGLSDQRNFVVLYTGTLDHPGGTLAFREENDSVEDAVWVFLDDAVGSDLEVDMFLEVHGFVWPDGTDNEPEVDLPAGLIDVEIIVPRCSKQISDVNVEVSLGGGAWIPISEAPTQPDIRSSYFPEAL